MYSVWVYLIGRRRLPWIIFVLSSAPIPVCFWKCFKLSLMDTLLHVVLFASQLHEVLRVFRYTSAHFATPVASAGRRSILYGRHSLGSSCPMPLSPSIPRCSAACSTIRILELIALSVLHAAPSTSFPRVRATSMLPSQIVLS